MNRTMTLLFTLFMLLVPATIQAAPLCAPPVLTSVSIQENTPGFKVDAEYPVLCQSEASKTIRDYVAASILDFKMTDPEHDRSVFPHQYEMMTRYAVWPTPGGRYVSVKLNVMFYTGGAHPNHWPMTWVFDMTDGSPLTLGKLFPNRVAALDKISGICREVLTKSLGNMYLPEMLNYGIEPVGKNFDKFILTSEGVAFYFAPYQVAPYAAGEQVVTIPYDHLEGYISQDIAKIAIGD